MLRRAIFSLIGGAVLVWSLVFASLVLAAPHGGQPLEVTGTARYQISGRIQDALLWPSFLFTRWQVPNPAATSGPAVPYGLPLWFFDVPLASLLIFGILSFRAARRQSRQGSPTI